MEANPADTRALEWADLVRQFLVLTGARSTPPHVPAIGLEEQGYHLVRQGVPILTAVDHVDVPGGVVRALVDPVPLYPWSLIRRREPDGRGSDTLLLCPALTPQRHAIVRTGDPSVQHTGDRESVFRGFYRLANRDNQQTGAR